MKTTGHDQQRAEASSVLPEVPALWCRGHPSEVTESSTGHVELSFHTDLCELSKKLTCAHCVCPDFSFYKLTAAPGQGYGMLSLIIHRCIKCLQDQGLKPVL